MKTHLKIFTTVLFVFACCAFLPQVQAATDTPDPGAVGFFNTADGFNALSFNASGSGFGNSAFGWFSGWANQDGNFNTSVGAASLDLNNGFSNNTAVGAAALLLSQGDDNTAVGAAALENNNANGNTAMGSFALFANQSAFGNTAVGQNAGLLNDISGAGTANLNTAVGTNALNLNVNAGGNTALGAGALENNDSSGANTATINTAVGVDALFLNVNAGGNTAVGAAALGSNDFSALGLAIENTAVGALALLNNIDGSENTAVGSGALAQNVGAPIDGNVAVGNLALNSFNGTGATDGVNTAVGSHALELETTGERNTAVGRRALNNLLTGSSNVALGQGSGFSYVGGESGNISIGTLTDGVTGENNTIRIGLSSFAGFSATQCFIGGIVGAPNFVDTVKINPATGQLGDQPSSARFKKDIAPMDKSSEAIYSLKPVTFHYKKDKTNTQQWGLIAEEVAKVNPALIAVDKEGKPYTVAYDMVNAMLLNEFLKEHKKVEEQQASIVELKSTVAQQQKGMEVLTAQLKEQAAQIQKVSAQLEVSKPAPQVVTNKP